MLVDWLINWFFKSKFELFWYENGAKMADLHAKSGSLQGCL